MVQAQPMSWLPASVSATQLPPPRTAVLEATHDLSAAVAGRFSTAALDRLSYARDLWPLSTVWIRQGKAPPPPDGIAWPGTEDELCALIRVARARRIALIPFGGGSGVCGGTWAIEGGIAVDLKRFERIGPIDALGRRVVVGAGVFGEKLERSLNAQGWTLGHFPSSIAMSTVGGWLAARSAGQLSSKYGKIEDMVLSARFVTGQGEVLVPPQRPFAGPDLLPLLVGSEGTFGFFTEATLRVFPLAEGRVFHGFEFASVEKGLEAIRLIFRDELRPAVVRLYDPFDTAVVGNSGGGMQRKPVVPPSRRGSIERDWLPRALRLVTSQTLGRPRLMNQLQRVFRRSRLVMMFEGEAKQVQAEDAAAAEICRALRGTDLGEAPGRAWFAKRYDVAFRMSRLIESGTFADTMEVAASWEHVFEVYERVHAAASQYAFVLCHFSHAYAEGCSLYFSFIGSAATEAEMETRYHQLWKAALSAAMSAGGNVSHHHGVGLLKARAYQESLGEGRQTLAQLKAVFDPDHLLNPGKLGLVGEPPRVPKAPAVEAASSAPKTLVPSSVAELRDALHVCADAGLKLSRDGSSLDRQKLAFIGTALHESMTVEVGAGARLRDIEAHLRPVGLSLGPLSPGAWALNVAQFIEGPHAGLRAVSAGRLESLALRLGGLSSSGQLVQTPLAPRSAAGPELSALFQGAVARLVVLTQATLKCLRRPEVDAHLVFHFQGPGAAITSLTRMLACGVVFSSVELDATGPHVQAVLRWQGSSGAVARTREVLLRLAGDPRGRGIAGGEVPVPGVEREVTWSAVQRALEAHQKLTLYRLSLASVIATGAAGGLALDEVQAWPDSSKRLLALDPLALLGGAP